MKLRSLVLGTLVLFTLAVPARADTVKLTTTVVGSGTVTSQGEGTPAIRCPDRCADEVDSGKPVTLRATGAAAWKFDRWSGSCNPLKNDPKACTISLTAADTVSAQFVPEPNTEWWTAEWAP